MRALLAIVISLLLASRAQATETANAFLKITVGTNGASCADSNYLNSVTHITGGGGWATNGGQPGLGIVGNNLQDHLAVVTNLYPRKISVAGTTYSDATNYYGMSIGHTSDTSSLIWNFTAPQNSVMVSYLVKYGSYNGGFNVFDFSGINGGSSWLIPQYWENLGGGTRAIFAHSLAGVGHGILNFQLNKWYVMVVYHDMATQTGVITLIDADTGVIFGQDSVGRQEQQSAYWFIGDGDNHGRTGTPSDPFIIKDVVVRWGSTSLAPFYYFDPVILNLTTLNLGQVSP